MTGSLPSDEASENIITLEQDHLNQIGSCVDVTGRLDDLIEESVTGEGKNNVVLENGDLCEMCAYCEVSAKRSTRLRKPSRKQRKEE